MEEFANYSTSSSEEEDDEAINLFDEDEMSLLGTLNLRKHRKKGIGLEAKRPEGSQAGTTKPGLPR